MKSKTHWLEGQSVIVKTNTKDPDWGTDIGGWQGRISDIEDDIVTVVWDSVTLKVMSDSLIRRCEQEGWGWTEMNLSINDIEPAKARGTEADVRMITHQLEARHQHDHLGEESEEIQAVLAQVDPDDDWAALEAWHIHLQDVLTFPFEAEIAEAQERGRLHQGDRVTVLTIGGLEDLYGSMVNIEAGHRICSFPLCDLQATEHVSPNYVHMHAYAVWFANR